MAAPPRLLACVLLAALIGGCVSSGHRIRTELLKQIQVGVTTSSQVATWLGEPSTREGVPGAETWEYAHARNNTFSTRSQRVEIRFERGAVASCRVETFTLDHLGRPQDNSATTCDRP